MVETSKKAKTKTTDKQEDWLQDDQFIGTLNNKYKIQRMLGSGASSRVFLATKIADKTQWAIKIFREQFINSGKEARMIYIAEVNALMTFNHPNIVKFEEYGVDGIIETPHNSTLNDVFFIVVEYV